MRRYLSTILMTAGVLAPLSCGDEQKATETNVTPSIQRVIQGFCDVAFKCCTPGEVSYLIEPYLNQDNCAERLGLRAKLEPSAVFSLLALGGLEVDVPNLGSLDRAAEEGRGHMDMQAVEACVTYLTNLECNDPPLNPEGCQPIPPKPEDTPCDPRKLFIGEIPAGEVCTSGFHSLECEPGLVCRTDVDQIGVKGHCVRPAEEGETCEPTVEDTCKRGLECSTLDGTCQHLRKEGETCVYTDRENLNPSEATLVLPCADHLSCDPVTDTCVAHCQRGAACSSDADCDDQQELRCIVGRCDTQRSEGLPCAVDEDCLEGLRCADDESEVDTQLICQTKFGRGENCLDHEECMSGFCDPDLYICADTVGPGALCPSGIDEECGDGDCVTEAISCTMDADCVGSNTCDLQTGYCMPYCVERLPAGAQCSLDDECASDNCIAERCRELPLSLGEVCEFDTQCESEFCGLEDERVCTELPLDLSAACAYDEQCESHVCFDSGDGNKCSTGLNEGEACGGYQQPPCNPFEFYCDLELDRPVCVQLREAGERCEHDFQCRGDCELVFGHFMCDATPAPDKVTCDGLD